MSNVLDALMPETRQKVLATLLIHPHDERYLSDLAAGIGTKPANIQREMNALADSGILLARRDGKRTYYRANTGAPTYPALRDLFEKTVGAIPLLKTFLQPLLKPGDIAFVFGSFARAAETPRSDIDLAVIGDTTVFDLSASLPDAEAATRRVINPVTYSAGEFREKWRAENHFVRTVMESPKQFLKGSNDDLARLIKREPDSRTLHQ